MTELEIARLEAALNTPVEKPEQFAAQSLLILHAVPRLIAEIRRLRSLNPKPGLSVVIPPDPSLFEDETMTVERAQAIVQDIGEIIEECCPEGAGFLLTFFDTQEDYEPVYTHNAGRGDTLKALRQVTELVEQS